jgi:hypothetical protein
MSNNIGSTARFLVTWMLIFCVAVFSSCLPVKTIEKASVESRIPAFKSFVVTSANDTIRGEKWDTRLRKKHWYIILDGKEYIDSSISAFQSQYGLATRFQSAKKAHSFIDQWAYYMRRGKLDVFSNERYIGYSFKHRTDQYSMGFYYRKDGEFKELTAPLLKKLIEDDPEALKVFNESKIKTNDASFIGRTIKIVDVYNRNR